jgi:pyruvate dehydrogenase E2 component (dihydrolipoamide acetyltransferase)
MSVKILMPALSPTMTDGVLQKWLVKVGDKVKAGDLIAEIETDKATMEVEAVDEGTITNILVKEGAEGVAVNSPIAILDGNENDEKNKIESESKDHKSPDTNKKMKALSKENTTSLKSEKETKSLEQQPSTQEKYIKKDSNVLASPYAKKLAKEQNINLSNIDGSGPSGRVIKRDFEKSLEQDQQFITSSKYEIMESSSIRKIIAERTTQTKNTVPHFYLTIESKVDNLLKLRKIINEQDLNNKISINDILVKALAIAQHNNPETNVSWFDGKIIKYSSVDVSIAVALTDGLITPIIKEANLKGLLEISKEIKILAKKAKEGKLTPEQYTGGTISISNLGMFGINEFAAIINPPQSSILAVGSIQKLPRVEDKEIKIANILKSTLSADHRVLDGAIAAKLLKDFHDIIENPFDLWLQSKDMELI